MDGSDRNLIISRLPSLVSAINNCNGLEKEALRLKLIPLQLIEKLKSNSPTHAARVENFFLEVLKRGPNAFQVLLKCLLESGNRAAFDILTGNPVRNIAVESNGSGSFSSTSLSLILAPNNEYLIKSSPKGNVLLINNNHFGPSDETRLGSKKDVERLKHLFIGLDFRVFEYHDLEGEALLKTLSNFANRDDHTDCCIVFVGSHGKITHQREGILCNDGSIHPIINIWEQFNNINCPQLKGKPKIFMFQICRGHKTDKVLKYGESGTRTDGQPCQLETGLQEKHHGGPSNSDVLCIFPTTYGYTALRDSEDGSWMVQGLCEIIDKYHNKCSLVEIINMTSQWIKRKSGGNDETQTLTTENMGFDKEFYFSKTTSTQT